MYLNKTIPMGTIRKINLNQLLNASDGSSNQARTVN